MRWPKVIAGELIGLFVDDERYAVTIAAWLVAAGLVLPRLALPPVLPPVILFAGLVAVLLESAARAARKGRSP